MIIRITSAVLILLLALLQYRLWISEDGLREVVRLQHSVSAQQQENAEFADRNERLAADVNDLKKGFSALEERARSDLGLIAPDETFYVFGRKSRTVGNNQGKR